MLIRPMLPIIYTKQNAIVIIIGGRLAIPEYNSDLFAIYFGSTSELYRLFQPIVNTNYIAILFHYDLYFTS